MMNGHFLPRKSKFVCLKISIELYRPAFNEIDTGY
jgi:hypothetical protein